MHEPECPFCQKLNDGEFLTESAEAFLARNQFSPQNYLIVPKRHATALADLPDTWWQDVKRLLVAVPDLPPSYNLSINIGKPAGQTVAHLHFWVIPRVEGSASSGKGLARLIDEANRE